MAEDAKKQTKPQAEAEKARNTLNKAKEAFAKNENAGTKAALAQAKEAFNAAVKAENRERFLEVGKSRTIKARAAISRLVNVASRKSYDYTPEEANRIVAGLKERVKEVENAFANSGNDKEAAQDDFSFG